jgi:hypothetical protein
MAVPQPTKEPEWASANPTDPISGQPAILEPSEGKKDSGHLRIERPPRQDHNWLFNLIWLWIQYFKSRINGLYSNMNVFIAESGQTPDVEDDSTQLKQAVYNFLDPGHIAGFHLMDVGFQAGPYEYSLLYSDGVCLGQDIGELINSKEKNSTPFPAAGIKKVFHVGDTTFGYGDGGNGIANGLTFSENTAYHVFAFYNTSSNLVDIALDDDIDGNNVQNMSGVIDVRRIGSIRMNTTAQGFVKMRQFGDYFYLINPGGNGFLINATLTNAAPSVDNIQYLIPAGITTIGFYVGHIIDDGVGGSIPSFTVGNVDRATLVGGSNMGQPGGNDRPWSSAIQFDSTPVVRTISETTGFTGQYRVLGHLTHYIDTRGRDWVSGPGSVEPSNFFPDF